MLVVLAVLALAGLVAVGRAAAVEGPEPGAALAWWTRPRTRRTLDLLETVAVIALVPLLAGVLGLYGLAADAGSRL